MIEWPSIVFPPINLYSAPKFTKQYLDMEAKYTCDITRQYESEPDGTLFKKVLLRDVLDKREEFNRLWNQRAKG